MSSRGPKTGRIRLPGGFGLSIGQRIIEADGWCLKKAANLVKLLALAPRHGLHRERVMDLLWPGTDPEHASNNFHRTLHSGRGVLASAGEGCLSLKGDLLELSPDGPVWVDVEAFEDASAAALGGGEPAVFGAAISLYAGDLLPENLFEEWTQI